MALTLADLLAPNAPAVITVEQTAELLQVSRGVAYESTRVGVIPALKLGRRTLVPVGPLLRLLGVEGRPER